MPRPITSHFKFPKLFYRPQPGGVVIWIFLLTFALFIVAYQTEFYFLGSLPTITGPPTWLEMITKAVCILPTVLGFASILCFLSVRAYRDNERLHRKMMILAFCSIIPFAIVMIVDITLFI